MCLETPPRFACIAAPSTLAEIFGVTSHCAPAKVENGCKNSTPGWLNRTAELEGKYTYVQSIGIRCDDLRQAHDTIARRLKPSDGSLRWLTPRTIGLYLPNVLGDLQLCFTDDDEGLIPFRELLERPDERNSRQSYRTRRGRHRRRRPYCNSLGAWNSCAFS